ncbi:HAD-IA family hydrolase [Bombilactobacillus thymidiniphilus]|uniref:HAD-IA family hydrolase n=1 Tax=Bombilactobacillus thymidiniphilus TaxID=2923363 RepID=A0ABY4PCV6_9LACO|nr:HAD-IA family hydrolase [Bombilactobacillus thymidiniphilus]UQS83531.1 HAD-IA family hydrolase [Bombilactobacillus thymidiniphilus]
MVLKNAIWDYDGTLADTYAGILKSLISTLNHFGQVNLQEEALYREIKLFSVTQVLQHCAKKQQIDFLQVQDFYRRLDHQAQENVVLYPQAIQVLQAVVSSGGSNYLLTHRDEQAKQLLQKQGIAPLFKRVITAADEFARKPDPAAINYLVLKDNLNLAQTAMIGDRSLDILAGKNAQVQTIYFDVDHLHDSAQADFVVEQLKQIELLFNK